jgi:hypothetical protein
MATGDVTWFNQGLMDVLNKIHDLDTDDIRLGLVNNTTVPSKTTAAPHWAGTGTTNFFTNQVDSIAASYTGPIALTTKSLANVANDMFFRADTITLSQNASGFTNGYWGILYNNTDANKRALGYVELGGPRSLVSGQLVIDWGGTGDGGTNNILKIAN